MKRRRVPILITTFSLIVLATMTRVLAMVPQPVPLSQMECKPINPVSLTVLANGTGEKPQSKVWQHGGEWWAVFPTNATGASSQGTWVFKLVADGTGYAWSEVLKISTRTDTKADVKRVGDVAHIFLFADSSPADSALVSIEYVAGTYQLWTTRPAAANISLASGSETATIDLDTTGRMWLATQDGSSMVAYYSDSPYSNWSNSVTLGSGTSSDDIAAVTALPGDLIGVLWSDQSSDHQFKFRIHVDGADPATWSSVESHPLETGTSFADDHINFAVATNGTLYAAIKTSVSSNSTIRLLVRSNTGSWSNHEVEGKDASRPIVALNELAGVVNVIYPLNLSNTYRPIVFKEADVTNISFGGTNDRQPLLGSALDEDEFNDPSGMKENYTNELVTIFVDLNLPILNGVYCQSTQSTPEADLGVTKVDAVDPLIVGDNVTYTLTVTNSGPDMASNVALTDTLPAGMNYISAVPDQGSCSENAGIVTCDLSDIANGSQVAVTLVASTTLTGTLVNTATVASTALDNNISNDSDSEETTVNDCVPPWCITQAISLTAGWNMVSSYVNPRPADLETLLADIESDLVIVRSSGGQVYWPDLGINTINDWNVEEGYQILMTNAVTLNVTGPQVTPNLTPISLPAGWNLVAYLRDSNMAASTALGTINGQLVLAKDGSGQLYWPDYSVDQLGDMQPGIGYQLYLSSSGTLTYPAN